MQAQYKTRHVAALTSHRGFDLLWQLSSATRQSVDAQRLLRSNDFTTDEVYALCRLCNHLEQPHRSQCMGELRKIMQVGSMTFPLLASPLNISALSHPEFFGMCKTWLRQYILKHKSWCIPFHLPSGSIRESAHSIFHRLLWNHKKFQPVCSCLQIRKQFSGSRRLVDMFLLQQNKLQHRFQLTWGFTFCTTVELQFFQINRNIFKRRSSSSFGGQNGMGSPYIGFRISVFFCVRSGSCIWHMLIELDAATLLSVC